jgi:hypothetical protein
MAAQAHDAVTPVTVTPVTAPPVTAPPVTAPPVTTHPVTTPPGTASRRRRVDAGVVQLSQRDIDGLLLCGEHFGAPFDLLATALQVEPERLPALTARWRRAGFAATGRLGPGPKWCWLTRDGMTATGLGFRAGPPALGRLAHVRAVLAARLWMEASPAWRDGRPWWHSERRLLAGQPAADRPEHIPDAEIHWPSIDGSPYAGQIWAIEVELTPKSAGRTTRIMAGLLSGMEYALVIYLTAARARSVVTRAAGSLPPGEQSGVVVRDLPGYAFAPRGSLPGVITGGHYRGAGRWLRRRVRGESRTGGAPRPRAHPWAVAASRRAR